MRSPFTRMHKVEALGGGAIIHGPTDALVAGRRDGTLTMEMGNGDVVTGFRLERGVVYDLAVNAILASSPRIDRVELWALYRE